MFRSKWFVLQLFRRLIDKGMTEEVEDHLSAMSKHLVKMQKYKGHHDLFLIPQETSTGVVSFCSLQCMS